MTLVALLCVSYSNKLPGSLILGQIFPSLLKWLCTPTRSISILLLELPKGSFYQKRFVALKMYKKQMISQLVIYCHIWHKWHKNDLFTVSPLLERMAVLRRSIYLEFMDQDSLVWIKSLHPQMVAVTTVIDIQMWWDLSDLPSPQSYLILQYLVHSLLHLVLGSTCRWSARFTSRGFIAEVQNLFAQSKIPLLDIHLSSPINNCSRSISQQINAINLIDSTQQPPEPAWKSYISQ